MIYFTPFVFCLSTCVGDEYRTSYNKKEFFENEAEANHQKIKQLGVQADELKYNLNKQNLNFKLDSFNKEIVRQLAFPFDQRHKLNHLQDSSALNSGQSLLYLIIYPTYYSISGIGAIFAFKNISGKIIIGISLFFSATSVFLSKLIKRKKIALLICILNFLSLITFLINTFISEVDLLWGFWLLFISLFIQLVNETYNRKISVEKSTAENL